MRYQTRYHRSMELRRPVRMLFGGKPFQHIAADKRRRRRFVASGYAWVDADVRGSGASYGARVCEWSPDEIRDGAEIVDWMCANRGATAKSVQDDHDRSLRDGAVAAHRDDYDVHKQAVSLTFRDDADRRNPRLEPIGAPIDVGSINVISPHNYWRDIAASGAAIYSYSGWFDVGYAHSASSRGTASVSPSPAPTRATSRSSPADHRPCASTAAGRMRPASTCPSRGLSRERRPLRVSRTRRHPAAAGGRERRPHSSPS